MLNFQSVFVSLMVIMFNLNQAALLSIQLLVMCQVFAESDPVEHRDKLASRGDSVIFTCNISKTDVTQIRWTRGNSVFAFSIFSDENFSNFTSHKITINKTLPSKMSILNVQHDDAGTYRCFLNDFKGRRVIEWNLTVTVEPEEISPPWYSLSIAAAIGCLLCVITTAVCLCGWTKIPNHDEDSNTLSYVQYRVELGKEVAPLKPNSCAEYRTNPKQVCTSRRSMQYLAC